MPKLVIFDLGGVVATTPMFAIQRFAWEKGIPSSSLQKLLMPTDETHPMFQLETGRISLSQFCSLATEFLLKVNEEEGVKLHQEFTVEQLMREIPMSLKVVPEMLNASAALKSVGIKTCILTNNWKDDTSTGKLVSKIMMLRYYFDDVFESCKLGLRKPDAEIFKTVCAAMKVDPSETIVLDDLGPNLKHAKELGMTTIHVKDPFSALANLKEVSGVDVFKPYPVPPVTPENVSHSYANLSTGIKMHYVDMGHGPVLLLLHGFPELWYTWKYQIPALALAGYRVIAPDLRGYGQTSSPKEISEYAREKIAQDLISLMDILVLHQVTVIGHDWGGAAAWDLAMHYPDRIRAVANMTPYIPPNPTINPLKALHAKPGVFQYQLYFHKEGPAEQELEKNLRRTFDLFYRFPDEQVFNEKISISNVLERGGFFVGVPEAVPRSSLLNEEDLNVFVQNYSVNGFRGPLNWYRNMEADWTWSLKVVGRKVQQPSLTITCGKEPVIKPALFAHMKDWVVNLTIKHIEESGHWTPFECPLKLNNILIEWLKTVHGTGTDSSKL